MVSRAARCLVLTVAVACATTPKGHVAADSDVPRADCPKLTDAQAEAFRKYGARTVGDSLPKALFMSFVIDGHRATMYVPKFQVSEAPMFYPEVDPGDILSMTPLSRTEAARWYRPCPGVEVIMIRTKAGNWRPKYPVPSDPPPAA
jgi:hypothetical protein